MSPAPRGQNAKKIALRYLFFSLGLLINSFGISIEIAPDVITVPGEGLVRVLAQATGKDFGRVKLVFDVSLIVIASALSLLFFGRLQGVGIGTVVSALIVGPLVSLFGRVLPGLGRIRALALS